MPRSTQVPPALFSVSDTGLSPAVVWLSSQLLLPTPRSRTAALQPQTVETVWFGLIPFRSPLLWESRLISFPLGTEMFHFPRSAPQQRYWNCFQWVAPFRDPRTYRSLSRLSSPSAPRHPPVALNNLFFSKKTSHHSLFNCQRSCRLSGGSRAESRFEIPSLRGGGGQNRTDDPLLAKQMLSQLSYAPDNGGPGKT